MPVLHEDSGVNTVAVASTAEAVGTTQMVGSLVIEALEGNTGDLYVGGSGVDNTRAPLGPGKRWTKQASVMNGNTLLFDIADVFVDTDNNGDGYNFWWDAN